MCDWTCPFLSQIETVNLIKRKVGQNLLISLFMPAANTPKNERQSIDLDEARAPSSICTVQ